MHTRTPSDDQLVIKGEDAQPEPVTQDEAAVDAQPDAEAAGDDAGKPT